MIGGRYEIRKWPGLFAFMLASTVAQIAAAEDSAKPADKSFSLENQFRGSMSIGFSNPLALSASLGGTFTVGPQNRNDQFASWPALRADGELGLGGGSVDAGLSIPVGVDQIHYLVSLKAVRMHTWLMPWNLSKDYKGSVLELATPNAPDGAKIGLGSFRATTLVNGLRPAFVYVYIGLGW